jgi:hypothetical protein
VLPLLLTEAALLDFAAINFQGVSSFCMSPAYIALIPAYGALWFTGRWFAGHLAITFRSLGELVVAVTGSAAIAEIISSGSFYFYSGRFTDASLAGFAPRFLEYFPGNLATMSLYVAFAAVLYAIIVQVRSLIADDARDLKAR